MKDMQDAPNTMINRPADSTSPEAKSSRKVAFVVLLERFSMRNFLLTPLFKELKHSRNIDVVIATPAKDFPSFPDAPHLRHETITLPEAKTWRNRLHNWACSKLESILFYRYQMISDFRGFDIRVDGLKKGTTKQMYLGKDNRQEYSRYSLNKFFFGQSTTVFKALKKIYGCLYHPVQPAVQEQFDRIKPDLLVTNEPHSYRLREYYGEAHNRGIRILSMVLSWDNVTLRGVLVPNIDKFLTWNSVMRSELTRYHSIPEEDITVVGLPHLDFKAGLNGKDERTRFLEEIDVSPDNHVIMFATSSWHIGRDEPALCRHLVQEINSGKYAKECTLVIRMHHTEPEERYAEFQDLPNVVLHRGISLECVDVVKNNLQGDSESLLRLIQASDVVVNLASTISLEANFMDTPVVNIAFDLEEGIQPHDSNSFFIHNEHYANFLEYKGTSIAFSIEEMDEIINAYLMNPELHAEGRANVRKAFLEFEDGLASKRIYQAICKEAGA